MQGFGIRTRTDIALGLLCVFSLDNIFTLHGLLTHVINQGKKLYLAFVNLTKGFDYINRDIFWHKLIKISVRGKALKHYKKHV